LHNHNIKVASERAIIFIKKGLIAMYEYEYRKKKEDEDKLNRLFSSSLNNQTNSPVQMKKASTHNQKANKFNWQKSADRYAERYMELKAKGVFDEKPIDQYCKNANSGKKLDVSEGLSERIEDAFGIDTSELTILESPAVAELSAKAIAQGDTISFAPGEYKPDTTEGLELLGHELNHIRDQALGKVTANVEGTNINIDTTHEANSERAGKAFAKNH